MTADPLEIAKDIERRGAEFYRKLAAETPVEGLKGVFDFLAGQEDIHYEKFSRMQEGRKLEPLEANQAMHKATEAFKRIAPGFQIPDSLEMAADGYRQALKLEHNSIDHYRNMLNDIQEPETRKVIEQIIAEEQQHAKLMDNMTEFVARPAEWLEDAEFTHLEEY